MNFPGFSQFSKRSFQLVDSDFCHGNLHFLSIFPSFFNVFLESWSSILSDHLPCLFEKSVPNSDIFRSKCGYFLDKCSIFRPFSKCHVYDVILKFFGKKSTFSYKFRQIFNHFHNLFHLQNCHRLLVFFQNLLNFGSKFRRKMRKKLIIFLSFLDFLGYL